MGGARKARKVMSVRANQHNSITKFNFFSPLDSSAYLCGLLSIVKGGLGYACLGTELS
jgi:hypothetical protein